MKQVKRILDGKVRGELLHDLNVLSLAWSPEVVLSSRRMFFEKWERNESEVVRNVIQHFEAQWQTMVFRTGVGAILKIA